MFSYEHLTASQYIWIFVFSTIFAFICAYYAEKKGRNSVAWFILGFLFNLYALIVLFFLSPLKKDDLPTMTELPPDPSLKEEILQEPTHAFDRYKEENQLWYYLDENHSQMGPVSLIALRDLWNRGLLELNQYVWCEGMEKWERVDDLPDLKKALNRNVDGL